nr:MAG TPA: hypothetical protein [Caudoviricetes sp.]
MYINLFKLGTNFSFTSKLKILRLGGLRSRVLDIVIPLAFY